MLLVSANSPLDFVGQGQGNTACPQFLSHFSPCLYTFLELNNNWVANLDS